MGELSRKKVSKRGLWETYFFVRLFSQCNFYVLSAFFYKSVNPSLLIRYCSFMIFSYFCGRTAFLQYLHSFSSMQKCWRREISAAVTLECFLYFLVTGYIFSEQFIFLHLWHNFPIYKNLPVKKEKLIHLIYAFTHVPKSSLPAV